MRHLLSGGLAAALLLTGCALSAPFPPPAEAPSAAPVVPEAVVSSFNGLARFYGEPLAGATVTAFLAGTETRVATATVDADGRFRLEFGADAPQGALLRLVAVQPDGPRVASLARVPMRQVQQAGDEGLTFILDEQRSMVILTLGSRFEAAGAVSLGEGGQVALSVAEEAFTAFVAALASVAANPPVSREASFEAGRSMISDEGMLNRSPGALQAVTQLVPPAVAEVLLTHADQLAVIIRGAVADGRPKPPGHFTDRLPIGNQTAEEVFQNQPPTNPPATGGGGSSGGVDRLPTPDASGALGVTDGQILNPTATPTITLEIE